MHKPFHKVHSLVAPAAGPPPRGVIARPADVRLPPPMPPPGMPPPPPGGPPAEQEQQQQRKAGAIISGKSTVVPLPKAHEDKRGEQGGGYWGGSGKAAHPRCLIFQLVGPRATSSALPMSWQ